MTTTKAEARDEFEQLLVDAGAPDRERATQSLARIHALKGQKKAIEDELASLEGLVKRALELDPTPLVGALAEDSTSRVVATLKTRSTGADFDLMTFALRPENERHLTALAAAGCLSARVTQLRGLKGKSAAADALLAIEAPGGVSHVLQFEVV